MKRTLPATFVAFIGFCAFTANAWSQDIPNPGFEEWTPSGEPAPFDWEEPTGWKSTNGVTEFIRAGVTRSNVAHSGGFSVSLETTNLFGSNAPGAIVNGNPQLDFTNYSINVMTGGTPISSRPAKLTGYYQFSSSGDEEYGYALIVLKKYNAAESRSEVIGEGELRLGKVSSFTVFNVPVVYTSDAQPDSVIVAFFSSDHGSTKGGGMLLVDDVALSFDASGVEDSEPITAGVQVYPNPASGSVNIELANEQAGESIIIFYDLLGREVMRKEIEGVRATIDLNLPNGMYAYRVAGGGEEMEGKVVVSR